MSPPHSQPLASIAHCGRSLSAILLLSLSPSSATEQPAASSELSHWLSLAAVFVNFLLGPLMDLFSKRPLSCGFGRVTCCGQSCGRGEWEESSFNFGGSVDRQVLATSISIDGVHHTEVKVKQPEAWSPGSRNHILSKSRFLPHSNLQVIDLTEKKKRP